MTKQGQSITPIDTPNRILSKHGRNTLVACRKAFQQLWSFYIDPSPDALRMLSESPCPSQPSCMLSMDPRFSSHWPNLHIHDLNESLALCMLALIGGFVVGKVMPIFAFADCLTLAIAYTIPLMKPTAIAETPGIVTGASKKIRPLSAIGNLLRAPTMEYVVDEVTRTHQAEVYEMKTDERPENTIAAMIWLRRSIGKFFSMFSEDQFSTKIEATSRIGMERTLL